jgi:FkbM family methyltransferase
MIQKLIKRLYKLGLLTPYQSIDGLRYLKRLSKGPQKGFPYVSDKDQAQFQSDNQILIRSQRGNIRALFLCNPRSHIDRQVIKQGLFSGPVFNTLNSHIESQSTIIDIGANVGTISIALSLLYPEADIHAFEPNPIAIRRLRYNQSLNQISNLTIHNKALGNKQEALDFHQYDDDSGDIGLSTFIPPRTPVREENIIPVDVTTLDSYSDKFIKPVSVIKIDVQGFEAEVLEGADDLIKNNKPVIILEHEDINFSDNEGANRSKQRLKSYFIKHRYEVFYITRYDCNMLLPIKWDCPLNGDLLALPLGSPDEVS